MVDSTSYLYSSPLAGTSSASPVSRISERRGISRDEMNLAEFPISVLSTRADNSIKTLEFSDTVKGKNGQLTERKWIITGADKFGLPTSSDEEVLLGLIKLTVDAGFESRKVFFTRYELMRILRWAPEGRNYTRLQRALDRLSGVRIKASNAFFDNESKAYSTRNFGVVDAYEINDGRGGGAAATSHEAPFQAAPSGGVAPGGILAECVLREDSEDHVSERAGESRASSSKPSFFIWSEVIFKSFQGGFIKRLDLDFYLDLKSAVSKRLYRYLDKHFWYRSAMRMNVFTLAHEKLGISRTYKHVSSIRQQLDPALEELLKLQFLAKVEYDGRGKGTEIVITRSVLPSEGVSDHRHAAKRDSVSYVTPYPHQHSNDGGAETERTNQSASTSDFMGACNLQQGHKANSGIDGTRFSEGRDDTPSTVGQGVSQPASQDLRSEIERLLIERGLKAHQLPRLLGGRDQQVLNRIFEIIGHFDFLRAKNSPLVSKSPIGFLYKAVESPERFSLPSERRSEGRGDRKGRGDRSDTVQQPLAFRPVTRSVPSGLASAGSSGSSRGSEPIRDTAAYLVARHNEIKRLLTETEPAILNRMRGEVRVGLARIKNSVSPEGFEKAVEHGLSEKLLVLFKFPSIEEWKRGTR